MWTWTETQRRPWRRFQTTCRGRSSATLLPRSFTFKPFPFILMLSEILTQWNLTIMGILWFLLRSSFLVLKIASFTSLHKEIWPWSWSSGASGLQLPSPQHTDLNARCSHFQNWILSSSQEDSISTNAQVVFCRLADRKAVAVCTSDHDNHMLSDLWRVWSGTPSSCDQEQQPDRAGDPVYWNKDTLPASRFLQSDFSCSSHKCIIVTNVFPSQRKQAFLHLWDHWTSIKNSIFPTQTFVQMEDCCHLQLSDWLHPAFTIRKTQEVLIRFRLITIDWNMLELQLQSAARLSGQLIRKFCFMSNLLLNH